MAENLNIIVLVVASILLVIVSAVAMIAENKEEDGLSKFQGITAIITMLFSIGFMIAVAIGGLRLKGINVFFIILFLVISYILYAYTSDENEDNESKILYVAIALDYAFVIASGVISTQKLIISSDENGLIYFLVSVSILIIGSCIAMIAGETEFARIQRDGVSPGLTLLSVGTSLFAIFMMILSAYGGVKFNWIAFLIITIIFIIILVCNGAYTESDEGCSQIPYMSTSINCMIIIGATHLMTKFEFPDWLVQIFS